MSELERYCRDNGIILSKPNGELKAIMPDGTIYRRAFGEDQFLIDLKMHMGDIKYEKDISRN